MFNFGIEIECYVSTIRKLEQELDRANIEYVNVGLEEKHKLYNCLKIIKDITLYESRQGKGIEINIPPSNDFKLLEKVCKVLNKINAIILPCCSLHIHVDLSSVDYENAKNILYYYKENEDKILNKIKKIQKGKVSHLNLPMKKVDLSKSFIPRKVNLNLQHAYQIYKTIEHRAFYGTIDFNEIKKCVKLTTFIVEKGLEYERSFI